MNKSLVNFLAALLGALAGVVLINVFIGPVSLFTIPINDGSDIVAAIIAVTGVIASLVTNSKLKIRELKAKIRQQRVENLQSVYLNYTHDVFTYFGGTLTHFERDAVGERIILAHETFPDLIWMDPTASANDVVDCILEVSELVVSSGTNPIQNYDKLKPIEKKMTYAFNKMYKEELARI